MLATSARVWLAREMVSVSVPGSFETSWEDGSVDVSRARSTATLAQIDDAVQVQCGEANVATDFVVSEDVSEGYPSRSPRHSAPVSISSYSRRRTFDYQRHPCTALWLLKSWT